MDDLRTCLTDADSCNGKIPERELNHVKKWHAFSKTVASGDVTVPATALLVTMHNMVTESIDAGYITAERKSLYCPSTVFADLKTGLYADDTEVQAFSIPTYTAVPGVPGLGSHSSISC